MLENYSEEEKKQMREITQKFLGGDVDIESFMTGGNEQQKPLKMDIKYYKDETDASVKELHYEHDGDSGFDIRSKESFRLEPLERKAVSTGLYFALPENIELQLRPKSGLALKKGLTVLNTPGTIDSNYRGEVQVILVNLGNEAQDIEVGDKVAQGVISTVNSGSIIELNEITDEEFKSLEDTSRGSGAFGSTGEK